MTEASQRLSQRSVELLDLERVLAAAQFQKERLELQALLKTKQDADGELRDNLSWYYERLVDTGKEALVLYKTREELIELAEETNDKKAILTQQKEKLEWAQVLHQERGNAYGPEVVAERIRTWTSYGGPPMRRKQGCCCLVS
jgi:hypothetical protein